jgi:hypothetical protein
VHEFTNIDRDELPALQVYVKGYLDDRAAREKAAAAAAAAAASRQRVKSEGGIKEEDVVLMDEDDDGAVGIPQKQEGHSGDACADSDSDEDDDDYDPDASDSDASGSGLDSDDSGSSYSGSDDDDDEEDKGSNSGGENDEDNSSRSSVGRAKTGAKHKRQAREEDDDEEEEDGEEEDNIMPPKAGNPAKKQKITASKAFTKSIVSLEGEDEVQIVSVKGEQDAAATTATATTATAPPAAAKRAKAVPQRKNETMSGSGRPSSVAAPAVRSAVPGSAAPRMHGIPGAPIKREVPPGVIVVVQNNANGLMHGQALKEESVASATVVATVINVETVAVAGAASAAVDLNDVQLVPSLKAPAVVVDLVDSSDVTAGDKSDLATPAEPPVPMPAAAAAAVNSDAAGTKQQQPAPSKASASSSGPPQRTIMDMFGAQKAKAAVAAVPVPPTQPAATSDTVGSSATDSLNKV